MTDPQSITTQPRPAARTLDATAIAEASAALRDANLEFAARYAGEGAGRQPVHTVYGGAHLFNAATAGKLGALALRDFGEYVSTPAALGEALGIERHPALATIHERVWSKLQREAIEDYRIDFEDGYGIRADDEEDRHAGIVVDELTRGMRGGTLPPFVGIRIKPLNEDGRERSVRTLDLVLTGLVTAGGLPDGWIITVPKITIVAQIAYCVTILRDLERALGLTDETLRFEIMIETPQVILDRTGRSLIPALVDAADGRLLGAHFGAYDYTAGCNITAAYQGMRHPASEFAKCALQAVLAGTSVRLSDGPTAILPVPVRRQQAGAPPLTQDQRAENVAAMRNAWRLHFDDARHGLAGGFYQGWDLHPAQLVSRYAAVYSFFLEGIDAAGIRLNNFVAKTARASLVGDVFDDAATGQGLLNFFLRGINSGAITEGEALAMTGLTAKEFRDRSFAKILEGRR